MEPMSLRKGVGTSVSEHDEAPTVKEIGGRSQQQIEVGREKASKAAVIRKTRHQEQALDSTAGLVALWNSDEGAACLDSCASAQGSNLSRLLECMIFSLHPYNKLGDIVISWPTLR
jgi:hypothetical protein